MNSGVFQLFNDRAHRVSVLNGAWRLEHVKLVLWEKAFQKVEKAIGIVGGPEVDV